MRFDVKKDKWLVLLLYLSVLGSGAIVFFVPQDEIWIALLSMVLLGLIILPLIHAGYYELKEEHLYIKMSFFKVKIQYNKIVDVKEVRFRGASTNFSLSFDQVMIKQTNSLFGSITISPQEKEEFMYQLKLRCPQLQKTETFE